MCFPFQNENLLFFGAMSFRVPTRTGIPGKWEGIFQSGKSPGKVMENDTKYWKIQGIAEKYYFLFLVIFK